MEQIDTKTTPRSFWIVSIVALVWNLLGVMAYLMSVTMGPEALAELPEAERALYENIPAWVTSAYAIAVFGGTLGCVLLLLRRAWAGPVFIVSLVGILIQMGYAFFMTNVIEVNGATSVIMPLLVIAVGIYLISFAKSSKDKGILT